MSYLRTYFDFYSDLYCDLWLCGVRILRCADYDYIRRDIGVHIVFSYIFG